MIKNELIKKTFLKKAINYIEKDPEKNFGHLIELAKKLPVADVSKKQINSVEAIWNDPSNVWHDFIIKILTKVNPQMRKKLLENFVINAGIGGADKLNKNRKKYNCNIPWAILMDPTSACNLKCIGCWAADYKKTDSLDYDTLSSICKQGKELGTYFYIFSGGEPMTRKNDLLKLAREHNDCIFLAFTNGTLFTEEFVKEVLEVGNLTFAISIEGYEKETDMRRGVGTYKKVIKGMELLKKYNILFGFSTMYHSKNEDIISSESYFDFLIDKGAYFGWFFTYIPIGKDAVTDLLATPEQREHMYYKIREYRTTKPLFTLDFWNDGEYAGGCIAGGRRYLHINSNGDVEPCAFIHYSNVNIKDVTLLEALQQPLFMKYHENQPFNENMLRPCPLLDNPEKLEMMVNESGAVSTQPIDKENVSDLIKKTIPAAEKWAPVADKLWKKSLSKKNK